MDTKRSHRLQAVSPDRAVVALADFRPAPPPQKPIAAATRPNEGETRAFAGKIELAATMTEALSAEGKCLRVPLPADLVQRLAHVEAELELIRHDVLIAGGVDG